jgi:TRAP-type C4-dicarboxylate transport system substrate-binding protein
MKRRNLFFSALLCGLSFVPPVLAQQVIKIATLAPEGSAWMRELRAAASEVQAGTQTRVQVKFYPGGVMGSDTVVLRKMRLGQLQGGVLTSSELAAVYPDAAIYSLPFLFDSWAQADKARLQIDPLLGKGFETKGLKMLAVSNIGFAYLMSSKPLRSRADMNGVKLWIPQNDEIAERTFKLGGVSPVLLPLGDVFTSLQTGLVDTVPTTPAGAVALQWHGKLRTMLDLPLSFVVGYVVLDSKAWQKLAPADQAIVSRAFQSAARRVDANIRHDDAAALAVMKKQGLTVNAMEPAEAARWRKIGAQVTRDMEADKHISANLVSSIRQAIAGVH